MIRNAMATAIAALAVAIPFAAPAAAADFQVVDSATDSSCSAFTFPGGGCVVEGLEGEYSLYTQTAMPMSCEISFDLRIDGTGVGHFENVDVWGDYEVFNCIGSGLISGCWPEWAAMIETAHTETTSSGIAEICHYGPSYEEVELDFTETAGGGLEIRSDFSTVGGPGWLDVSTEESGIDIQLVN